MEKKVITLYFDMDNPYEANAFNTLSAMGRKRSQTVTALSNLLADQFGSLISPKSMDTIMALVETKGLVPAGYIAIPIGNVSAAPLTQVVPVVSTKSNKTKKTNKKKTVTNNKAVDIPNISAPAEVVPVKAEQHTVTSTPPAQTTSFPTISQMATQDEPSEKPKVKYLDANKWMKAMIEESKDYHRKYMPEDQYNSTQESWQQMIDDDERYEELILRPYFIMTEQIPRPADDYEAWLTEQLHKKNIYQKEE